MKTILASLFLMTVSFSTLADTSITTCSGITKNHVVQIDQVGSDVHASVEDKKFNKYQDIGNASEGKFKASGKEKSSMILHSIELPEFIKRKKLATEFMVAIILGRPEFRGEEDMIYSYADEFIRSLDCK